MAMDHHDHDIQRHDASDAQRPAGEISDAAGRSLADALRVSFLVLKAVMILVVLAWAFSGVAFIKSGQVGILRIFGRIVGTVEKGLAYNFPFPIGSIERVSQQEQVVTVEDFWIHETAEDKTKPLSERGGRQEGLRAGWDGALLTGDRNLLHMKLSCHYAIKDPIAYKTNLTDAEKTIRLIVCDAAITAGAQETAEGLMFAGRIGNFIWNVQTLAQKRLNALNAGIEIAKITREGDATVPIQAIPDYRAYAAAADKRQTEISDARKYASGALSQAVGKKEYEVLVGSLDEVIGLAKDRSAGAGSGKEPDSNLIGEFLAVRAELDEAEVMMIEARKSGNEAKEAQCAARIADRSQKAQELLDRIGKFIFENAKGEARGIVDKAVAKNSAEQSRLRVWLDEFRAIAQNRPTREARAELMDAMWNEVLFNNIVFAKTVVPRFVPPGDGKVMLKAGPVPEVSKRIRLEKARLAEEERERQSGG